MGFPGDDGRFYESEAAWEHAYDEGCKAEMRAILAAEMDDPYCDDDDDDGASFFGRPPRSDRLDEIPF